MLATTLYWVMVWRTVDAQKKEVFFSKKLPPNLRIFHNGQLITIRIILAALLWHAKTGGHYLATDTWEQTPEDSRWVAG